MNSEINSIMKVKEWAEKSGLKLYNYDGFTDIYNKLSKNAEVDLISSIKRRFSDAGELGCSRKAFVAGIFECTIGFPRIEDYEKMSDFIPEFVEYDIANNLRGICKILGNIKSNNEYRNVAVRLSQLVKIKAMARKKSIEVNKKDGVESKREISFIDDSKFSRKQKRIFNNYKAKTVEGLEEQLFDEIIKEVDSSLKKKKVKISDITLEKVNILDTIYLEAARNEESPNEIIYINLDNKNREKEPFYLQYNLIGKDEITKNQVFDLQTEKGKVLGANPIKQKEINKSLKIIDGSVKEEERKGYFSKLKGFVERIKDKGKEER